MLKSAYAIIRALSLDVVAGAIIGSLFLAKILAVSLPFPVLVALGLAVWVIYTIDHLLDVNRLTKAAENYRLRFHQKYFRVLSIVVLLALLTGLSLIPLLPLPTIIVGLAIAVLVVIYFILIGRIGSKPSMFKELMAAVIYCVGVFAAPLTLAGTIDQVTVLLFFEFILLAWVNLLEFSYFEIQLDKHHGFGSSVMVWGKSKTVKVVTICLLLVASIAAMSLGWWDDYPLMIKGQIVLFAMALLLAFIAYMPAYFKQAERFRILGDAVFLLPLLIWI